MSRDPECAFCRIVAGEIPASVVFENESLTVFLDINPLAEGHLLIIPKEHFTQIKDMPPDLSGRLLACVPSLGKALLEVTGTLPQHGELLVGGEVLGAMYVANDRLERLA